MMSWSCPFHSFQLPFHVPVIFSVCPLHCPCMSRSFVASHFPTSPVVPIGFLVLCFSFIPPALPLFAFRSLSCPVQFPFVSLSSPHFLALPCISPLLPSISRKQHGFPAFSAEGGRKSKPAKSRQGDSSLGPLFCDTGSPRLVGRHQITARYVGELGVRHAGQCRRMYAYNPHTYQW